MEHRKLTKKEKWAIGGGAAVIALASDQTAGSSDQGGASTSDGDAGAGG